MTAYYNEHDPKAAAWLRELIKQGHIAPGDVDERSIEDVVPNELAGYTQCHFFAGIGVWSYALRQAGWSDSRRVWTGSCPCQPFSAAGKGEGFADERHLWPAFYHLISQCRPGVVFGEQVASSDGLAWLDLVYSDLEAAGYAVGTNDLCAAGFGAPHIRQRLFFVADAEFRGRHDGRRLHWGCNQESERRETAIGSELRVETKRSGFVGRVADADGEQEHAAAARGLHADIGECGELGNAISAGSQGHGRPVNVNDQEGRQGAGRHAATAGFWSDAEWLYCRDGKYRPTEPGVSPLAHGTAERVGRLRGFGNAIVAPVAEAFIRAYLEAA